MTRLAFSRRGGTLPPYPSRRGEIEELVALTGIKYLTKLPRRRREGTWCELEAKSLLVAKRACRIGGGSLGVAPAAEDRRSRQQGERQCVTEWIVSRKTP